MYMYKEDESHAISIGEKLLFCSFVGLYCFVFCNLEVDNYIDTMSRLPSTQIVWRLRGKPDPGLKVFWGFVIRT